MGTFDSLDTAARVRSIIQKSASRQVKIDVPRPLVGRVISVDLPNLSAMVWFSGDQQPIPVNLLSSTVPASWARRFDSAGVSSTSTATEGFGSMAICQRFNGTLYITDVITGGQFTYNLSALNIAIQELLPDDGSGDIAGTDRRSLVSMKVSSFNVSIPDGGAVMFGPFMAPGNDSPTAGNTTVMVSDGVSSKRYDFTFVLSTLTEGIHASYLDQWYRILPESESLATGTDWDLDVAYRETPHGLDRGVFQSQEVWFRIVNRNGSSHVINHSVSIDSDLFQRPQGFDNKYSCENILSASMPIGYLGFHEPGTSMVPISDTYGMDAFGRTVASPNWGQADTHEPWDEANGVGSVNGQKALLVLSAANQTQYKTITPDVNGATLVNVDQTGVFSVPATAATTDIRMGVMLRYADASNYYKAVIVFRTDSKIRWEFIKRVAGVETVVDSFTSGSFTYAANDRWAIRVTMDANQFRLYVWNYDTMLPSNGMQGANIDGAITASGKLGVILSQGSGGTNTYPFSASVHLWKGGNSSQGKVQVASTTPWRDGAWRSGNLRMASLLQHTISSFDSIDWNGSELILPNSITLDGVGLHRSGLAEGRTIFSPPVAGAQIPIIPSGTFATVSSSGGIPLDFNQSLWLGVPPGSLNENLRGNLFIIDNDAGEILAPEWAVMIAHSPSSSVELVSPLKVIQENNGPRGIVPGSFVSSTSNSSAITTGTALQSSSFTLKNNRAYKFVYRTHLIGSVAGAFANLFMRVGTGAPSSGDIYGPVRSPSQLTTSPGNYVQISAEFVNTSGSDLSVVAAVVCTNTSGTCTHIADSTKPRFLYVEDIGYYFPFTGLISAS